MKSSCRAELYRSGTDYTAHEEKKRGGGDKPDFISYSRNFFHTCVIMPTIVFYSWLIQGCTLVEIDF
jgi:hypothetical protein